MMNLYYTCTKIPSVLVTVGDLVDISGAPLRVKTLPETVGAKVIMQLPSGGLPEFDYEPSAIGMYWN